MGVVEFTEADLVLTQIIPEIKFVDIDAIVSSFFLPGCSAIELSPFSNYCGDIEPNHLIRFAGIEKVHTVLGVGKGHGGVIILQLSEPLEQALCENAWVMISEGRNLSEVA